MRFTSLSVDQFISEDFDCSREFCHSTGSKKGDKGVDVLIALYCLTYMTSTVAYNCHSMKQFY